MPKFNYVAESSSQIEGIAGEIVGKLQYPLVLLMGELGAGKTTLVKEIIEKIGSDDLVSSPSYSIINHYYRTNGDPIYHIDLYRMNDADEVLNLGIEEYLYSGHHCFLEWPQIILDIIDDPYHIIKIEIMENSSRKILLT